MAVKDSGQAGAFDEIEITPAMVEAGVDALKECTFGQEFNQIAWYVYLMMETERMESVTR